MSEPIIDEKWGVWYIRCRRGSLDFIAWCGLRPMSAPDPINEPQEPLFFEFGDTAALAIERLKKSITP